MCVPSSVCDGIDNTEPAESILAYSGTLTSLTATYRNATKNLRPSANINKHCTALPDQGSIHTAHNYCGYTYTV